MSTDVKCPTCGTLVYVHVDLGESIMRARDKALIEHNKVEHP